MKKGRRVVPYPKLWETSKQINGQHNTNCPNDSDHSGRARHARKVTPQTYGQAKNAATEAKTEASVCFGAGCPHPLEMTHTVSTDSRRQLSQHCQSGVLEKLKRQYIPSAMARWPLVSPSKWNKKGNTKESDIRKYCSGRGAGLRHRGGRRVVQLVWYQQTFQVSGNNSCGR